MKYYHGSPLGGLTELKPFLSEHGKPYIYLTTNPLVALLYAVKPVSKPYSFYPYGFDENRNVVYSEYYPNAFHDIYKGKTGYLYECEDVGNVENPTQISCAYTSNEPVKVSKVVCIKDIYEYYIGCAKSGVFCIKPFEAISEKEMEFVYQDLRQSMAKYDLKEKPDDEMSIFIKQHFQKIWVE